MSIASGDSVDVLLLAAHPLELAPLASALGTAQAAELHGRRVAAAAVGVGLPAAGAGTARALARYAPSAAVLLGSYGAYPGAAFTPGALLVPSRIQAVDTAELTGRAAFPQAMPRTCEPDAELCAALADTAQMALRAALATTLGITTDDALARELGERSGCAGENMEALAVGLACREAGVPFAAVLGCTNRVGARGRAEWLEHRELAARAAAEQVLTWITAAGR